MCNLSYLISRSGILKIISVIIGAVSLYGGIRGYIHSDHNKQCRDNMTDLFIHEDNSTSAHTFQVYCDFLWMERSFLSGVSVITLISIISLVVFILSDALANSTISNIIDFGFHFVGAILLMLCGIFMAFSAMEIDDNICKQITHTGDCQLFYEKVGAAGLSLLDGILFLLIVLSVNKITMFPAVEQV